MDLTPHTPGGASGAEIPAFPEFAPIGLAMRDEVTAYLTAHPPLASEYTFTNLYGWQEACNYAITRYGNGYLIRKGTGDRASLLQPLVPGNPVEAIEAGLAYLRSQGVAAPLLDRVGEDGVAALGEDAGRYDIVEDRDQFDYVYQVEDLVALRGERFHDKKNLLNQCLRKYDYVYRPLTGELAQTCVTFARAWCEARQCTEDDGLAREHCAIVRMLNGFDVLKLSGAALYIEDRLVAFTLAEQLNPETQVIHAEKAQAGLTGIYQAINWEYLRQAVTLPRVNREQDLGVPGLRKAKLSYNPAQMVRKYRVRQAV